MNVLLTVSTKYKKKLLSPGKHAVTKAKAKEWEKLGIATIVEEKKVISKSIIEEGMMSQLQAEAEALGIDTKDKDFETLKAEVEGFGK